MKNKTQQTNNTKLLKEKVWDSDIIPQRKVARRRNKLLKRVIVLAFCRGLLSCPKQSGRVRLLHYRLLLLLGSELF